MSQVENVQNHSHFPVPYSPCPCRCGASDQTFDISDCPFREECAELCSIITNTSGPFQHCHFRIDPEPFFTSCVYDLCAYPQTWGQDLLCSSVEAYDAACTTLGLQIPDWRSDLICCKFAGCMHPSLRYGMLRIRIKIGFSNCGTRCCEGKNRRRTQVFSAT